MCGFSLSPAGIAGGRLKGIPFGSRIRSFKLSADWKQRYFKKYAAMIPKKETIATYANPIWNPKESAR